MPDLTKIEQRVDAQQDNINTLVNQVTKLSTIVEGVEKRYEEERKDLRDMFIEIRKLGEGVANSRLLEEKFNEMKTELKDKIAEVEKDTKVQITALQGSIKSQDADLTALKNVNIKADGAKEAIGQVGVVFWTIFGGVFTAGFIAVFLLVMRLYFGIGVTAEVISTINGG